MSGYKSVLNVLRAPHVTEKSTQVGVNRCYALKVLKDATKPQIKAAVESAFSVVVDQVRTCQVKPKYVRRGKVMGTKSGWKKAYVTLAEGHTLELAD